MENINNKSEEIRVRKFKSSFTGKLLKNGIEIDSFSCIEEYTDVRFKIITNKLYDIYSFKFDFDEDGKEYKMNKYGDWNFKFPEYDNPTLNMTMGIRDFKVDGVSQYKECY